MVAPRPGVVVLVRFPFSDLSSSKLRPAVVLANAGRGDWVLCQITSNPYGDSSAVQLRAASFASGGLGRESYARPGKLFTAHESLMVRATGTLASVAHKQLIAAVTGLLQSAVEKGRRTNSGASAAVPQ